METTMRARWAMPAVGLAIGALLFVASAIGGQPVLGLGMFAVMAIYTAVLVIFGDRSETIGVLGGRPADERLASFNTLATAIAARGQSGNECAVVAAAAGIAYLAAVLWLRWRG